MRSSPAAVGRVPGLWSHCTVPITYSTCLVGTQEGYRDGLNAGRESTLQHGFNKGYQEGVRKMLIPGQMKGLLSALLSWCHLNKNDPNLLSKVNQLLDVATQQEELIFRNLTSPPRETNVSDVIECIEDMGLDGGPGQPDMDSSNDAISKNYCHAASEIRNHNPGISSTGLVHQRCCRTASGIDEAEMVQQLYRDCVLLLKDYEIPVDVAPHFQLQP
ncbi:OTU deubiquitinase with linear linkage specificity a [Pristis pectinata]|uniref:OTU deubiquitinase with linear linkage specificity a n=1 Tax=Pristis pectinata TaxID=685728 RepID=UPI00223CAE0D|nr:OTU deubiquitinase with linear linkage specificity a [Pristis pectinata]